VEQPRLNAESLNEAENIWIKFVQATSFKDEIQRLNSRNEGMNQLINQLALFLDKKGVIRCQGRLENTNLPHETKRPILLPSKHRFIELIIEEEHQRVHHNGIKETLNCIRERFWILRGRGSVKRIVRRCTICKKFEGKSFSTPIEPSLPSCRVSDEPPFSNVGIDFAGPLLVTEKEHIDKTYICLFTCASTRGVHLELLRNLSTDMFLQAFRRFVSRRGVPNKVITNNAKTFKGASREVLTISPVQKV
jgi:hypothetical protein